MTLTELMQILLSTKFKNEVEMKYSFSSYSIKVNSTHVSRWEIKEEEGEFYLITEEPLGSDKEIHIRVVKKTTPIILELTFKQTGKHFVTLEEI